MLPLSEELRQAAVALKTWFELHKTGKDSEMEGEIFVYRALGTLAKAVGALRKYEAKA